MSCSISKSDRKQISQQAAKIQDLIETTQNLCAQVIDLQDARSKKKPIYMMYDQEIDDLYVFKTDVDKQFAQLHDKVVRIQEKLEMKEHKNIQDRLFNQNEITQKANDHEQFFKIALSKEEIHIDISLIQAQDQEETIPKNKQKQNQTSLTSVLDDEVIKNIHDGLKSKLFETRTSQGSDLQVSKLVPQTEKQKQRKTLHQVKSSKTQQQFNPKPKKQVKKTK